MQFLKLGLWSPGAGFIHYFTTLQIKLDKENELDIICNSIYLLINRLQSIIFLICFLNAVMTNRKSLIFVVIIV